MRTAIGEKFTGGKIVRDEDKADDDESEFTLYGADEADENDGDSGAKSCRMNPLPAAETGGAFRLDAAELADSDLRRPLGAAAGYSGLGILLDDIVIFCGSEFAVCVEVESLRPLELRVEVLDGLTVAGADSKRCMGARGEGGLNDALPLP